MKTTNPSAPAPFTLEYSPNVPELLLQLQCTLAISTYQAGKLIFLSPVDVERLIQLPRTFAKPMGIGVEGDRMVLATKDEVILFRNSPELATHYPRSPGTYDSFYMPRATFYTGMVDLHDIDFGSDGIYAVNTSFSSVVKITPDYSFEPVWTPPFISALVSEDRCHLNGLALENGRPRYVTAFGTGDSFQSWREKVTEAGILMDITNNEMIATGLKMPHSPRMYQGHLYVLFSATGELVRFDLDSGLYEVVYQINGFVRGLAFHGDYAFIGLSRLRKNSSTFAKLPIADYSDYAGVAIVHVPTGAYVGRIKYNASVDEIYDVQVLPGSLRPGIVNTQRPEHKMGLHLPGATFWANPEGPPKS